MSICDFYVSRHKKVEGKNREEKHSQSREGFLALQKFLESTCPYCTYTKAYLTTRRNVELISSVSMSVYYLRQKVSMLLFLALGIILLGLHNMGKLQNLVCPRRMFWKKLLRKCPSYQKNGGTNPLLSLTTNST